MLLALDVGNTNILIGVFQGKNLKVNWRISTDLRKTPDEYGLLISNLFDCSNLSLNYIDGIIVSSVVPPLTSILNEMLLRFFNIEPILVEQGIETGMPVIFDNPGEIGADRIVNGVAAYELYGGPSIVVDFGTAITFDAISGRGEYLGGAITPGIGIATEALFQKAAKLPRIELAEASGAIGKSTVAGMQAGIVYGYIGQVEGIVSRMKKELGGKAYVIATGGEAKFIGTRTPLIDKVDLLLTLKGLRLLYCRNSVKGV